MSEEITPSTARSAELNSSVDICSDGRFKAMFFNSSIEKKLYSALLLYIYSTSDRKVVSATLKNRKYTILNNFFKFYFNEFLFFNLSHLFLYVQDDIVVYCFIENLNHCFWERNVC